MDNEKIMKLLRIEEIRDTSVYKSENERHAKMLMDCPSMSDYNFKANMGITGALNKHVIYIRYYKPLDSYFYTTGKHYKITKIQAALICDHCQMKKYYISNDINFDYVSILRRLKIDEIMKKI
jgi:hypothetical protein